MLILCKRMFLDTEDEMPAYAIEILEDSGISSGEDDTKSIWIKYALHSDNVGDFWESQENPGCTIIYHREFGHNIAVNISFDEMIKFMDKASGVPSGFIVNLPS